jgi:hypothetical protein
MGAKLAGQVTHAQLLLSAIATINISPNATTTITTITLTTTALAAAGIATTDTAVVVGSWWRVRSAGSWLWCCQCAHVLQLARSEI